MDKTGEIPQYEYIQGGKRLFFDSIEYECATQVSQYTVMANGLHSAVNGTVPEKITLRGRFLKDDFNDIAAYFYNNSGKILTNCVINGALYNQMVLIKGSAKLGSSEYIGEMVMVLQEVKNS